jgi:hypothetical protein
MMVTRRAVRVTAMDGNVVGQTEGMKLDFGFVHWRVSARSYERRNKRGRLLQERQPITVAVS